MKIIFLKHVQPPTISPSGLTRFYSLLITESTSCLFTFIQTNYFSITESQREEAEAQKQNTPYIHHQHLLALNANIKNKTSR